MPYNPGISYHGDAYIANSVAQGNAFANQLLAQWLGDTIKRGREKATLAAQLNALQGDQKPDSSSGADMMSPSGQAAVGSANPEEYQEWMKTQGQQANALRKAASLFNPDHKSRYDTMSLEQLKGEMNALGYKNTLAKQNAEILAQNANATYALAHAAYRKHETETDDEAGQLFGEAMQILNQGHSLSADAAALAGADSAEAAGGAQNTRFTKSDILSAVGQASKNHPGFGGYSISKALTALSKFGEDPASQSGIDSIVPEKLVTKVENGITYQQRKGVWYPVVHPRAAAEGDLDTITEEYPAVEGVPGSPEVKHSLFGIPLGTTPAVPAVPAVPARKITRKVPHSDPAPTRVWDMVDGKLVLRK